MRQGTRGPLDAFTLARRQLELDRAVIGGDAFLSARKLKKLGASPLGFFRGSARLFYEMLRAEPALAPAPGPVGHIVGDMHLENIGAYRNDADEVVFDLNDFDDASIGEYALDRLRVSVSVLLAARAFSGTAAEALSVVGELLGAYDEVLSGAPVAAPPKPITDLCDRARKRTRKDLIESRAPIVDGRRRFVRGERYQEMTADEQQNIESLVDRYRVALAERVPPHAKSWRLVDAARRVAGNGSIGRRRIAFLVADQENTMRMFELKEAAPAAPDVLATSPSSMDASARVVGAACALVAKPPRQLAALGPTPVGSLVGRKLCPEEDKLDLTTLTVGPKLSGVARVVGGLLGRAHARDAGMQNSEPLPVPRDHEEIVDRAVYLAGVFEATYLAFARLAG
ncbi:MAG: DUF2252 family protein [Polyangiaceae bacterium]